MEDILSAEFADRVTPGGVFSLIRDGLASSRADLARLTGLAPSTVAQRIDALIDCGFLEEAGTGSSKGGRRPRNLQIASRNRAIAGVDLGVDRVTIVLYDLNGQRLGGANADSRLSGSPAEVLGRLHDVVRGVVKDLGDPWTLVGIGLAVPGPVSHPGSTLVSPSQMPGWNGASPDQILSDIAGVPVVTENDATAMAWGDFVTTGRGPRDIILLKAGGSIGTGIVAGGRLHRGNRGMAGDISHTTVPDAPQILCSCGRFGCLDVVAGGAAMLQALRQTGLEVAGIESLAQLGAEGHPLATRLLREAGMRIGTALGTVVSFFNPQRLALAGPLATADAFTAGIRSSIYTGCLPLSTAGLEIVEVLDGGPELGALGAAQLFLDDMLASGTVDREVATFFENRS